MVGAYMQDAIERGGYRAALEYYGGDEAKESEAPWHRLRALGWLLGRLGLYGQVQGWLEEAAAWSDFDHLLPDGCRAPRAAYRPPPLWLEAPVPARRSTGRLLTIEPAAAAGPDAGTVPGYIWTAMLILNAAGPICSRAGLGAAAFLVGAGAARQAPCSARGDAVYDPCRGARLHGAPEECHRWIIADIDFDPRPVNKPHYYYDLTDEGRAALESAGGAVSPWARPVEAASSRLGGMTLPDLLEGACRLGGSRQGLDGMKDDLARLLGAWSDQEKGRPVARVRAEDQALADLGPPTKWHDTDEGPGSTFDHLLYTMSVIRSTHAIACEAEPSNGAEGAVVRTLVGAIQRQCRGHGRAVAAAAAAAAATSSAGHSSPSPSDLAKRGESAPQRPPYADATPALISDLYYCLAEYCRSRRLAVDPFSLPLSEVLTEDERDYVAAALTKSLPPPMPAVQSARDG